MKYNREEKDNKKIIPILVCLLALTVAAETVLVYFALGSVYRGDIFETSAAPVESAVTFADVETPSEPTASEPSETQSGTSSSEPKPDNSVSSIKETVEPKEDNKVKIEVTPINASQLTRRNVLLPVEYLPQNPELPTGCEITALTTVLNYYGFNVSKTEMASRYLEKSSDIPADFWSVFLGDPTDEDAFGCYAQPITDAANKYFADNNADYTAYNRSGTEFEILLCEVQDGNPVVIWGTMQMKEAYYTYKWEIDGKTIQWIAPEHCLVLIGYDIDRGVAIMSDPQYGIVEYELDTVKARYAALHYQCVVIEKK